MAKSKIERIWYFLSNNSIEISDASDEDLKCTICNRLSIEPYASLCGCLFCAWCIKGYLNDDKKTCPGNTDECRMDILELNRNVVKDLRTCRRMANVTVKCPIRLCDFKSKLEDIEQHFWQCTMGTSMSMSNKIDKNTDTDISVDSQSNRGTINYFRHELIELREKLDLRDREMEKLKDELKEKGAILTDLKQQMGRVMEKVEYLQEINLMKETEMNEIKEDFNKRTKTLMSQGKSFEAELEPSSNIVSEARHLYSFRNKISSSNEELDESVTSTIDMVKELRFNAAKEFYWTIKEFSRKQKSSEKLRSAPFYRHSYKMHLFVSFAEESLRVLCHILKGEFDAYVKWPMTRKVTLGILNQETMKVEMNAVYNVGTYTNKSAFERPQGVRNEGFGCNKFVQLDDIFKVKGILYNDSLVLFCIIDE